jgi:hypothetical protein
VRVRNSKRKYHACISRAEAKRRNICVVTVYTELHSPRRSSTMLAWSTYIHQACLLWKSIKHYTFIPAIEMHTWRKHPSSCALQPLCPSQQSQALLSATHQHIKKLQKKIPFDWIKFIQNTRDPEFTEQRHNTKSAIQISVLPKPWSSCHVTFVGIKHMQLTVG